MAEVKFRLVDVATWKTPGGLDFKASDAEKKRILETSLKTISEVSPVQKRHLRQRKASKRHLLVLLANGEPMSALFFKKLAIPGGEPIVEFHFKTRKGLTHKYTRLKGVSPALQLFRWMKRKAGKNAIIVADRPLEPGKRFLERLRKGGELEFVKRKGSWSGFRDTGKKAKPLKRHRIR